MPENNHDDSAFTDTSLEAPRCLEHDATLLGGLCESALRGLRRKDSSSSVGSETSSNSSSSSGSIESEIGDGGLAGHVSLVDLDLARALDVLQLAAVEEKNAVDRENESKVIARKDNHTDTVDFRKISGAPSRAFEDAAALQKGHRRNATTDAIVDRDAESGGAAWLRDIRSLEFIADLISHRKCNKIVVLTGAGISTSAGIPDFRSPGTGIYSQFSGNPDLTHPEAVFSIDFFRKHPEVFCDVARKLYPGNHKPTPTHQFIRQLADRGLLLRNYTQNIDGLERLAGIPADKLVEAHGTFSSASCIGCRRRQNIDTVKQSIMSSQVPTCSACGDLVKPDIVFFGEDLPESFRKKYDDDLANCDLLIVIGTSLKVQPFASLIGKAGQYVPRLLINREVCGTKGMQGFRFRPWDLGSNHEEAGGLRSGNGNSISSSNKQKSACKKNESSKKGKGPSSSRCMGNARWLKLTALHPLLLEQRDFAWLGNCDEGTRKLSDLCGW